VLVVGGDVAVAARVEGDVVVIGGDVYMHPGGAIEGQAVALGGSVERLPVLISPSTRSLARRGERSGPGATLTTSFCCAPRMTSGRNLPTRRTRASTPPHHRVA
jgi:hypothetical protein